MRLHFLRLLLLAAFLGSNVMSVAYAAEKAEAESDDHAKPKGDNKSQEEGSIGLLGPSGPRYVNISPFVLPVVGDNGPEQLVTLSITLELADPDKADIIRERLPRLNDAYLQVLYGALDKRTINRGVLLDVGLVKKKLEEPTRRVLGDDVVKEILVQAIAQRHL